MRLQPRRISSKQNNEVMQKKGGKHPGAFGAYLMPQWPIYGSKGVCIYQNDRWKVAVNSHYLLSGQKPLVLVKNDPNRLFG